MKRFQVIGFGLMPVGESDTLRGAKMVASSFTAPMPNGTTYKPKIYLATDCVEDGFVRPLGGAKPCSIWDGKTWEDFYPVFGEM